MTTNTIQIELFQRIRPRLKNREAVKELAGLLHLSHSAIYKRLNGTVPITMEEFILLCQQFEISADDLLGFSQSTLMFTQPVSGENIDSYSDFLEVVLDEISRLILNDGVEIWYVTNEIPFFHQFLYPELSAFKYYYYARHVWELPAFQKHMFSLDSYWLQQPSRDCGRKLWQAYYQVPGIEIWTPQILDKTLNQIRYFLESGAFKRKSDALRIIEAMRSMVHHFQELCSEGKKCTPNDRYGLGKPLFEVYFNEVNFSNNLFLLRSSEHTRIYITYDNPNFLKNEQPSFARYTEQWFNKLRKRSTPLSGNNERVRDRFFNSLQNKLNVFESSIKGMLHNGSIRTEISPDKPFNAQ